MKSLNSVAHALLSSPGTIFAAQCFFLSRVSTPLAAMAVGFTAVAVASVIHDGGLDFKSTRGLLSGLLLLPLRLLRQLGEFVAIAHGSFLVANLFQAISPLLDLPFIFTELDGSDMLRLLPGYALMAGSLAVTDWNAIDIYVVLWLVISLGSAKLFQSLQKTVNRK